jgi:uncharacterized protein (DUF924 family)
MTNPERILSFWLGTLDEHGLADRDLSKRWWTKSDAFDSEVRTAFEGDYHAIAGGQRESWLDTARGSLAYVIVLDQFSRNMFRGTAQMYAEDDRALSAAKRAVERGLDTELATDERVFLYMPFMHSEEVEDQRRCVQLFEQLADELSGPAQERARFNTKFAHQHRDIVEKWGRFPHRNAILGRETTAEEREFLKQPGSSF